MIAGFCILIETLNMENMEPLTTLFRNVSQVIPLHFDHANLLKANLIFLYCQHKSVL